MEEKADRKILLRIKKLLALAENNDNINEAASAAAMASKLMAKFNLERADVLIKEMKPDDLIEQMAERGQRRVPQWMSGLVVPIARAHDCEARYSWKGSLKHAEFLGQREDATVAAWVFQFLVDEVERLSKVFRRQLRKERGAGHGVDMGDYRDGLVHEIQVTLRKMREEKEKDLKKHATGQQLVVMKNAMITQKYDVRYKKLKSRQIQDSSAYSRGRTDGQKISLGKKVIGNDKRTSLK